MSPRTPSSLSFSPSTSAGQPNSRKTSVLMNSSGTAMYGVLNITVGIATNLKKSALPRVTNNISYISFFEFTQNLKGISPPPLHATLKSYPK